jgi:hypothetical protein
MAAGCLNVTIGRNSEAAVRESRVIQGPYRRRQATGGARCPDRRQQRGGNGSAGKSLTETVWVLPSGELSRKQ